MNLNFAQTDYDIQEAKDTVNRVIESRWLASGSENEAFEKEFAEYIGVKYAVAVNSGSSANLLALSVLKLQSDGKVLTSACGFPATLSPILHLGLHPVLKDYEIESHNIDIQSGWPCEIPVVKAVILAHTLGNPVDPSFIETVQSFGIPVIEDCCEAVGSRFDGKSLGSFGTLGTFSFYPAHQITAGGSGGMVVTNDKYLAREVRSMRDWGKVWDWDEHPGDKKTNWTSPIGEIMYFKHYTYINLGYNMKLPEIGAAFGRAQIKKLDSIRQRRMENFEYLSNKLARFDDKFIRVKSLLKSEPSWFGYPLTLRDGGFNLRNQLGDFLESKGIRIRPFFAGNLTRHEPFWKHQGSFPVADKLMKDSLFFGCGQWMGKEELDYIVSSIEEWLVSR